MGAGISAPTLPVDEIQLVAAEVSKTFTPAYAAAFGTHLLKDIKKTRTAAPKEFLLERAPPPSDPLWSGTLQKLGAVRRTWKSRHFIVRNESDNFAIQYFVSAAAATAGKPPKGSINLCWYRVERCTSDSDKATYGEHSVRLKPWWSSDRRRTWFVRAASEAELDAVVAAFEIAARKADAPLNPDPVMRAAFKEAMTKTRHRLNEHGWFYFAADEAAQLAMLVSDRCERGCMREVYAKIPTGAMENVVRHQVQKSLDTTVGAATAAAWRAASSTLMAQKPELRKRADETSGPIFQMQADLQARIREGVSATLEPRITEGVAPLIGSLSEAFFTTLRQAYEQSISIFAQAMARAATGDAAAWQDALTAFARDVQYANGALKPAFDAIRALTQYGGAITTGVGATAVTLTTQDIVSLLCGVELWQVERAFEEGIRGSVRAAVYTLRKRTTETTADKPAAVAAVVAEYVHDAKLQSFNDVLAIFMSVVMPPLDKDVMPALKDVLTPISTAVPDAMKAFVDVDALLQDLVTALVTDALTSSLLPSARITLQALDRLAGSVPVKPLKGAAATAVPASAAAPAADDKDVQSPATAEGAALVTAAAVAAPPPDAAPAALPAAAALGTASSVDVNAAPAAAAPLPLPDIPVDATSVASPAPPPPAAADVPAGAAPVVPSTREETLPSPTAAAKPSETTAPKQDESVPLKPADAVTATTTTAAAAATVQ